MVDVFDEVDEQIRAERFRALVRRTIPYFIGAMLLCVALVVAVWGYREITTSAINKASDAYAKGMDLVQKGDTVGAMEQFGIASRGPKGYASLALMQEGGIRIAQHQDAEAVKLFDQAAKTAPDKMIGDMASLKAAYALMDTASLADITARLDPLKAADRPYHAQALEALAIAKLAAGKTAEAKSDLSVLQLMADTPATVGQRAALLLATIDSGAAKSLKDVAKAVPGPPAAPSPQDVGAQAPAADPGN